MDTKSIGLRGRRDRDRQNNPREGDTTTKEGHKFVFKNGSWVKASNAKPAAKPDWRSKVTYNDPKKPQDKTTNKPQPVPAATPKPSGGGSSRPAPTGSKPSPQGSSSTSKTSSSRNVGPVANGDEYARNKDPKKYNPLMQKTFGYQKGDAPDQRAAKAKNSTSGVGPVADGKQYAADKEREDKKGRTSGVGPVASGAEYGRNLKSQPASPAKPASPNEPKKKKASETLAEALRKRRTGR